MYVWSDILSPHHLRVVEPTDDGSARHMCTVVFGTGMDHGMHMDAVCMHPSWSERRVSGGLACEREGRWSTLMPPALSGV